MRKPLALLSIIALFSCGKNITKTCECKDAWGQTVSKSTSQTRSKKDSQAFVDECNKKSITSSNTSGSGPTAVTTTTVVPCRIID